MTLTTFTSTGQDSKLVGGSRQAHRLCCSTGPRFLLNSSSRYNLLFKTMDRDVVLQGGRHWIWPWNKFIRFPAVAQSIEFSESPGSHQGSLTTRTKDGLGLSLSISFQYKLEKDRLPKLYSLANLYYEPLFIRNARDVLLKAAADYDAPEYWEKRQTIGDEMRDLLGVRMKESYAQYYRGGSRPLLHSRRSRLGGDMILSSQVHRGGYVNKRWSLCGSRAVYVAQ